MRDSDVTRVEVHRHPSPLAVWRVVYWAGDSIYDLIEAERWDVIRRIRGRVSCGFRLPTERRLELTPSVTRDDGARVWLMERAEEYVAEREGDD